MGPFPFDTLPHLTRRDARILRGLARRLDLRTPRPLTADPWASRLGGALRVRAGVPVTLPRAKALALYEGTALCAVFAHPSADTLLLALPRPLARTLAARALGDTDPRAAHAPRDTLSPVEEGALFALLSHAVTEAFAPSAPPVLRAVTDDFESALDALTSNETLLAWPLALTLGDEASSVTALADVTRANTFVEARSDGTPRRVDLPLEHTLVAARALWTPADVASLAPREVLSLDGLRASRSGLSGEVTVRVAKHLDCAARLDDGAVTLTETPHERTLPMNDSPHDAAVATIPVELTVEIARGASTVGEVSAWRPGEVVTFETPIGAAVTVRANGRVVAEGELVEVDGAVGVRVTALR